MGAYNVVNRAALQTGQTEDISWVLANFDAIAAILNGGIDDSNISPTAAMLISKLAGYPGDTLKALFGDGTWRIPTSRTFKIYAGNPLASVLNTVAAFDLLGTGGVGYPIPANTLTGRALRMTLLGDVQNSSGATRNVFPGITLGGLAAVEVVPALAIPTQASRRTFVWTALIAAIAGSNTIGVSYTFQIPTLPALAWEMNYPANNGMVVAPLDLTAIQNLVPYLRWDVANAATGMRSFAATFEVLG